MHHNNLYKLPENTGTRYAFKVGKFGKTVSVDLQNICICIRATSASHSVLERITSGKTPQKLSTVGSSQCFISKKQGQMLLMNSR